MKFIYALLLLPLISFACQPPADQTPRIGDLPEWAKDFLIEQQKRMTNLTVDEKEFQIAYVMRFREEIKENIFAAKAPQ